MKILTVVGARPQFVKAAMVSRALARRPGIVEILVHTGQHYDDSMSRIFFQELGIPTPSVNLGVCGGPHGEQTGRMLMALERTMLDHRPDWVLVYGDTNSTLAGALAAAKLRIPLAHVEAGLRSFDRSMPEEINRVVADSLADILFTPTRQALENLTREGIGPEKIHETGDVMYDAALHFRGRAARESRILDRLGFKPKSYVLATVHRAANTDDPARLGAIIEGLSQVAAVLPVVLPLHPRTRQALGKIPGLPLDRLTIIEPVGYLDMLWLEHNAAVVATDSGGVQKEAFFFLVPCVTMRAATEWIELVRLGWNVLADPAQGPQGLAEAILAGRDRAGLREQPYGSGEAAHEIAALLQPEG